MKYTCFLLITMDHSNSTLRSPIDTNSSDQKPIVRYGVENKSIPGDPTGWWAKDCGNLFHWADIHRYRVCIVTLPHDSRYLSNNLL